MGANGIVTLRHFSCIGPFSHRHNKSRIRIDGVNIDHLKNSISTEGPFSWITSGKLDAVFDIKFPRYPEDGLPFNTLLEEIADAISTLSTTANPLLERIPGQRELAKPPLIAPEEPRAVSQDAEMAKPTVIVDIDLRFRDLKAAVPIFTRDLSYVNNALIRPIVAFMKYVIAHSSRDALRAEWVASVQTILWSRFTVVSSRI